MTDLSSLCAEVEARLAAVADDPDARYALRADWNRRWAPEVRADLDFLAWEIDRGVLAPLDAERPGSRWWRKVQATLSGTAELAGLCREAGLRVEAVPPEVAAWYAYLDHPSASTWYAAHDHAVVRAYLLARPLARAEPRAEQVFLSLVLYRVIVALAAVEGRRLGVLASLVGDPNGRAVALVTSDPLLYPTTYPCDLETVRRSLAHGERVDAGVDAVLTLDFTLPDVEDLYRWAGTAIGVPELVQLQRDGRPAYP
jgi:hypothetical protein